MKIIWYPDLGGLMGSRWPSPIHGQRRCLARRAAADRV